MSYIFLSILVLIFFTYILVTRRFNYWKRKNVPYVTPLPIFGNYIEYILLRTSLHNITEDICKKFPGADYFGTFYGTEPALVVKDPKLLKLIMTQDYYYFNAREVAEYTHNEILTQNIFFTQGDRWRVLRQNLSPLFTLAKMKNMFYLVKKCSLALERLLDRELTSSQELEVTDVAARYTIDCISSCGFGVDSNALDLDDTADVFRNISKQILIVSNVSALKFIARTMWPRIFYGLGLKAFNPDVNSFFHTLVTGVFKSRNYKPTFKNDFVDLLLSCMTNNELVGDSVKNMKTGGNDKVRLELNDDLLVAQCLAIFLGGYETTSFTLAFILYELAKEENVQEKAFTEVDEYLQLHTNGIEYDCVEMPYISACVDEALRLYPILGLLTREVVEDYTLPTGLLLTKGSRVHIPVQYLHYNPEYFPEPNEFRPERFLGENKKDIKPYTYMPFGEGPRICVGMRFAKMQLIAALIPVLKNYKLELAQGMARSVKLEPRAVSQQPMGGIRLRFLPRNIHTPM